ncbi:MAG TPA: hypothetical protein VFT29_16420 [Gemmatimonadaceae bacterium]|nr:hypothetical protein [Gemmatimonadaceae bacterium]
MLVFIPLLAGGCRDAENLTRPDNTGVDRAHVTGAAAAALDADGQFVLPALSSGWSRTELGEAEAAALADAYVRVYAPTLPSWFERVHGAKIDFAALRRCGRVFYALSPYVEPPMSTSQSLVNAVSSQWLFSYCDGRALPAVSVAVAAAATNLRFAGSRIDPASLVGNEIDGSGIPMGMNVPISPEGAVERLAKESQRRISTVPRLLLPGVRFHPQVARWELATETPVATTNSDGQSRSDRLFFLGSNVRSWDVVVYRSRAQSADSLSDALIRANGDTVRFQRRSDVPLDWERAGFGGRP